MNQLKVLVIMEPNIDPNIAELAYQKLLEDVHSLLIDFSEIYCICSSDMPKTIGKFMLHKISHPQTVKRGYKYFLFYYYYLLKATLKAIKLTRSENICAIISFAGPLTTGLSATISAKVSDSSSVVLITGDIYNPLLMHKTIQGPVISRISHMIVDFITTFVARNASKIIVLFEGERNKFIDFGASESNVLVIPKYTRPDIFKPMPKDNGLLEKYRLKDKFIVGYIGRLSTEKGVKNFVDSIPLVLEKEKNTKFLIIGEGSMRNELIKKLSEYSIQDSAIFAGFVLHRDLPKYLSIIDLLVLPSYREHLPVTILESMAVGIPVIASSVGAIPEVIDDCENGILLKENNPESICDAISCLKKDKKLRAHISQNSRKTILNNYSYEIIKPKFEKVIKELCNNRP